MPVTTLLITHRLVPWLQICAIMDTECTLTDRLRMIHSMEVIQFSANGDGQTTRPSPGIISMLLQ